MAVAVCVAVVWAALLAEEALEEAPLDALEAPDEAALDALDAPDEADLEALDAPDEAPLDALEAPEEAAPAPEEAPLLADAAAPLMILVLRVLTMLLPPLLIVVKIGTPKIVTEEPLTVAVATALPPDEMVETNASVETGTEDAAPEAPLLAEEAPLLAIAPVPVTVLVLIVLTTLLPPLVIVVRIGTPKTVTDEPLTVTVAAALPPEETVETRGAVEIGMEDAAFEAPLLAAEEAPLLAGAAAPVTVLVLTVLTTLLPPVVIVVTIGTPKIVTEEPLTVTVAAALPPDVTVETRGAVEMVIVETPFEPPLLAAPAAERALALATDAAEDAEAAATLDPLAPTFVNTVVAAYVEEGLPPVAEAEADKC